jgi:hypothetical protein
VVELEPAGEPTTRVMLERLPRLRRPSFAGPVGPATFVGLRHPLVGDCVPNSAMPGPVDGLILTGANMTGKSTFLRSLGLNVVLAQSIVTVFADAYRAPWMTVRTSISPTDELLAGKSLYQKEAETVVSVVGQAQRPGALLCLFDELFRGTNSVDRISARRPRSLLVRTSTPRRCIERKGDRQAAASGMSTVTVVPRPSALSTSTANPERTAMALTMARPRPVPSGSIATALGAR